MGISFCKRACYIHHMTHRENILARVRALNLPKGEFIVVGSGSLAAHEIRGADDIDILATPALFQELTSRGWEVLDWTKSGMEDKKWLVKGDAQVSREMYLGDQLNLTFNDLIDDTEDIEGVTFMALGKLAEFKRARGKDKDLADVARIEKYLA